MWITRRSGWQDHKMELPIGFGIPRILSCGQVRADGMQMLATSLLPFAPMADGCFGTTVEINHSNKLDWPFMMARTLVSRWANATESFLCPYQHHSLWPYRVPDGSTVRCRESDTAAQVYFESG